MPKSKVRKKTDYTISSANRTPVKVKAGPSSAIYVSLMLGFMVGGLLWLMTYYLLATPANYGDEGKFLHWMSELGPWNFLISFGLMITGLVMTMRWR